MSTVNAETAIQPTKIQPDETAMELQALAEVLTSEFQTEMELNVARFDTRTSMATWYLGKLAELEARRITIKQQAKVMLTQIDGAEKYIAFRWGDEFKGCIEAMLQSQGGKKKSIDLLTGRAGFRKKDSSIFIRDSAAALKWCKDHCPDALEQHIARTTPIKEHIESGINRQTGEIPEVPGVEYNPPTNHFYPSSNRPELEYSKVAIT